LASIDQFLLIRRPFSAGDCRFFSGFEKAFDVELSRAGILFDDACHRPARLLKKSHAPAASDRRLRGIGEVLGPTRCRSPTNDVRELLDSTATSQHPGAGTMKVLLAQRLPWLPGVFGASKFNVHLLEALSRKHGNVEMLALASQVESEDSLAQLRRTGT
jgi:hypothetical protein